MVGVPPDDTELRKRKRLVLQQATYRAQEQHLQLFDYHILDKLEVCLRQRQVIDTWQYADDAEIRAWLETCDLNLLRIYPHDEWIPGDIGLILNRHGGCRLYALGSLISSYIKEHSIKVAGTPAYT